MIFCTCQLHKQLIIDSFVYSKELAKLNRFLSTRMRRVNRCVFQNKPRHDLGPFRHVFIAQVFSQVRSETTSGSAFGGRGLSDHWSRPRDSDQGQEVLQKPTWPDVKVIYPSKPIQIVKEDPFCRLESYLVEVEQIGPNPSFVNKELIGEKNVVKAFNADVIYVLDQEYGYQVFFVPPPPKSDDSSHLKRSRNRSETLLQPGNKRMKTTNASLDLNLELHSKTLANTDEFAWKDYNDGKVYVMTTSKCKASSKVASFDMDGTLIKTKSGKVFPVDHHDWQLLLPEVPSALKELNGQGFKLVIFTNQAGIAKGKVRFQDFQQKVERISQRLGVPLQLFCSTAESGMFRKPRPGLWHILTSKENDGIQVDMDHSFYCGDAAGRQKV